MRSVTSAALRRIAHRVVEQVAQQHGQQLIIPLQRHLAGSPCGDQSQASMWRRSASARQSLTA
jgi:hypothetical protein